MAFLPHLHFGIFQPHRNIAMVNIKCSFIDWSGSAYKNAHFNYSNYRQLSHHNYLCKLCSKTLVIALKVVRRYAPHQWQFDLWQIYVRLWTGLQSAHLCGQQSAGSQCAYGLGSCTTQPACLLPRLGQTDGSWYSLMSPYDRSIINFSHCFSSSSDYGMLDHIRPVFFLPSKRWIL